MARCTKQLAVTRHSRHDLFGRAALPDYPCVARAVVAVAEKAGRRLGWISAPEARFRQFSGSWIFATIPGYCCRMAACAKAGPGGHRLPSRRGGPRLSSRRVLARCLFRLGRAGSGAGADGDMGRSRSAVPSTGRRADCWTWAALELRAGVPRRKARLMSSACILCVPPIVVVVMQSIFSWRCLPGAPPSLLSFSAPPHSRTALQTSAPRHAQCGSSPHSLPLSATSLLNADMLLR